MFKRLRNYIKKAFASMSSGLSSLLSDSLLDPQHCGRKPRVFIGSSSEGLKVAESVEKAISEVSTPVLWPQLFQAKRPFVEVLEREAKGADFAVLVATPDDPLSIRGTEKKSMRDNVLFEFGLFSGALGRAKTHLLLPDDDAFRIPTDLVGVAALVHYSPYKGLDDAIRIVRNSISKRWSERDTAAATLAARERVVRLLRFVAWVRDEIAKGTQDSSVQSIEDIAAKLQGVSAFFLDDVDELGLRGPFDEVITVIEHAANDFPPEARHIRREIESLIRGENSVNYRAVEHLLAEFRFSPDQFNERPYRSRMPSHSDYRHWVEHYHKHHFHECELCRHLYDRYGSDYRRWVEHWYEQHWHHHDWRDCRACREFNDYYGYPPAPPLLPWDRDRLRFMSDIFRVPFDHDYWPEHHHPEKSAAITKAHGGAWEVLKLRRSSNQPRNA